MDQTNRHDHAALSVQRRRLRSIEESACSAESIRATIEALSRKSLQPSSGRCAMNRGGGLKKGYRARPSRRQPRRTF